MIEITLSTETIGNEKEYNKLYKEQCMEKLQYYFPEETIQINISDNITETVIYARFPEFVDEILNRVWDNM